MNNTDFGTAQNVVTALNRKFGQGTATALDGRVVQVRTPMEQSAQARFLSQIEDVQVARAPTVAKVIINARTGSVVMNRTVMIEEAAVATATCRSSSTARTRCRSPTRPSPRERPWWCPTRRSRCARKTARCSVNTSANLADVVRA